MRPVSKGFTLIELLVVIAIIGILSSVVLASLNTARERAANARRLSDMKAMQNAFELYALSNNGSYPNVGNWANACTSSNEWAAAQVALAPYIASLPRDPNENCASSVARYYSLSTSAIDYKIVIHVPPNAASASRSVYDPTRDGGPDPATVDGTGPWAWAVYSSSAAASR